MNQAPTLPRGSPKVKTWAGDQAQGLQWTLLMSETHSQTPGSRNPDHGSEWGLDGEEQTGCPRGGRKQGSC